MTKLVNFLRRNPRMTMTGIVLVIVLVAVVLWMVTRGGEKVTDPRPTIMFTTGTKVLNPAQKGTTETYVEYAGTKTAEYIDIVVNWQNGAGFTDKVTGLKFVRSKGTTTTSGTTTYATLDTMYEDDIEKLKDFASGSVTFLGTNIPSTTDVDAIIGNNYIQVWYTKDDTGDITGDTVSWLPSPGPLATTVAVPITIIDIDTTYDISQKQAVVVPISVSSTFSGDKTDGKKTYYSIQTIDGTEIKKVRITEVVSGGVTSVTFLDDSDAIYNFGLSTTSAITFKFEDYMGNKLLSYLDNSTRKYLQYNSGTITFVGKSDIFTDQATLNKSLLTIVELSYTEWGDFDDPHGKYYINLEPAPFNYTGSSSDTSISGVSSSGFTACIDACDLNPACESISYDGGDVCYFKSGKIGNQGGYIAQKQGEYISHIKGDTSTLGLFNDSGFYSKNPSATKITARYIRFQKIRPGGDPPIDIHEVFVKDTSGTELKTGATVTGSHSYTPTMGVDKLKDSNYATFASTLSSVTPNDMSQKFRWIEMDLGGEKDIAGFWFFHRHDYYPRVQNMKVIFMDDDRNIVEITPELPADDSTTRVVRHEYKIAENPRRWESVVPDSSTHGYLGI